MARRAATLLLATAAWIPAAGAAAGEAEIIAELQRQVTRCWIMPPAVTNRAAPVTLTFKLSRDGSVEGVPTILRNPEVLEYAKVFLISASAAIEACQPYRLPDDAYDVWKDVKITFRPPEN